MPCVLTVFPFFSRDFRGFGRDKKSFFWGGGVVFLAFFPRKQGRTGHRVSSFYGDGGGSRTVKFTVLGKGTERNRPDHGAGAALWPTG